MHWSQLDWGQILVENMPLLLVPVCAALLGLGIGRLVRGRPYIGRHG